MCRRRQLQRCSSWSCLDNKMNCRLSRSCDQQWQLFFIVQCNIGCYLNLFNCINFMTMKCRNTLLLFHKIRVSGGNCHLFMLCQEFVELQSLCSWLMEMQLFLMEEILIVKCWDCLSWELWHVVLSFVMFIYDRTVRLYSGVTPCLTRTGIPLPFDPVLESRKSVAHRFWE